MELKQFIESALLDIMEGVKNAQDKCPHTAVINPPVSNSTSKKTAAKTIDVAFDIEIGAETAENKGAKIGVALGIITVGAGTDAKETGRSANRLTFSIPIRLPLADGEDYGSSNVTFH